MTALPVITAFGGVNPAGRSSFHHATRRLVFDALPEALQQSTLKALAALSGRPDDPPDALLANSLIRAISATHFDTGRVPLNTRLKLQHSEAQSLRLTIRRRDVPAELPEGWRLEPLDADRVSLVQTADAQLLLPATRVCEVGGAGQIPDGFDPGSLYQARSHPRGVQLAIYAASDMLRSSGLDWSDITSRVDPDGIAVYAGSAMSQLDEHGNLGLLASRYRGKRPTSKQLAFGLSDMPADFVNAYVLGNVGSSGHTLGACATFLYNLRNGVNDIREGRARVAIVGTSEAPLSPEVIEGYSTMGALATVDGLRKLDGLNDKQIPDFRRSCRPFGDNCGFTLGEGAQFVMLMDDALALELGATIHGAVTDVFVNADGFKKSISSPGVGNYLTVSRATAALRSVIGEKRLRERSMVQAHGTGTPQNRTTESAILSSVAEAFGIEAWPVVGLKAFVGHTVASASGDQLVASLGIFEDGILPGITTIESIADDVQRDNLQFSLEHRDCRERPPQAAVLNAKGFGGNNASAAVLSSDLCREMLQGRHGEKAMTAWQGRQEAVAEAARDYDRRASEVTEPVIYRFDHEVLGAEAVAVGPEAVTLSGYTRPVKLDTPSPFAGLLNDSV